MIDFYFDFETRSYEDLKKVGAVKYALHPTTEATLLTFATNTDRIVPWRRGQRVPDAIREAAAHPERFRFVAHNVEFDYLIWCFVFLPKVLGIKGRKIPVANLDCTMARALRFCAGRDLDGVSKILHLPYAKNQEGRLLMLKQCKPSKKTGEFVELTAEEWDKFEAYGIQDTNLLRLVDRIIPKLSPSERWAWEWTFRANLKGLRLDVQLLEGMAKLYRMEVPRIDKEFSDIVGGQFRVTQREKCLQWFKKYIPDLPDMRGETLEDALANCASSVPRPVKRALELKLLAGNTSLAKVATALEMQHRGRIHQNLVYHGTHTKRWAGKGLQVQNFPRVESSFKNPELALKMVATDPGMAFQLYEDVPALIKNLLRRIFIPDEGKAFYSGDYSKIEPTVLFWLVGLGTPPKNWYEQMAAEIYGTTPDKISKDGEPRQLGKATNLGCLAKGTPVLTILGYMPIEKITTELVWDGDNWVDHGGLLVQGMKTVIRIASLSIDATPDHLFLTNLGWQTAVEVSMDPSTQFLKKDESLTDGPLSDLSSRKASSAMSRCAVFVGLCRVIESTNYGSVKQLLVEVARNHVGPEQIQNPMQLAIWLATQGLENVGTYVSTISENAVITHATKIGTVMEVVELNAGSSRFASSWNTLLHLLGLTNGGLRSTGLIMMDTMSPEIFASCLSPLTVKTVETFDLANCGPNNRFIAAGVLTHNCGYGMGWKKFIVQAKAQFGLRISKDLAEKSINAYRRKYHVVVQLWHELTDAFINAFGGRTTTLCRGKIVVTPMSGRCRGVRIQLPSGSSLYYHDAAYGDSGLIFHQAKKGQINDKYVYGGLLTEHVVSATSRDIMLQGMFEAEKDGFEVLNTVHDELWAQGAPGRLKEFEAAMLRLPKWADGVVVTADVKEGERYWK